MLNRILTAVVLACVLYFATRSLGLTQSNAMLAALVPIVAFTLNILESTVIAGTVLIAILALVPQSMKGEMRSFLCGSNLPAATGVEHPPAPDAVVSSDAIIGKLTALDAACQVGALEAKGCREARTSLLKRALEDGKVRGE